MQLVIAKLLYLDKNNQAIRKKYFCRTVEASETPIETTMAVLIHQNNAISTGPEGDLLFPIQLKSRH